MIASPRPKVFGFKLANPLRIRGLKEARFVSRLTLTHAVSHEATLLEPTAFARKGNGKSLLFYGYSFDR